MDFLTLILDEMDGVSLFFTNRLSSFAMIRKIAPESVKIRSSPTPHPQIYACTFLSGSDYQAINLTHDLLLVGSRAYSACDHHLI
jgi:hypothetical protein